VAAEVAPRNSCVATVCYESESEGISTLNAEIRGISDDISVAVLSESGGTIVDTTPVAAQMTAREGVRSDRMLLPSIIALFLWKTAVRHLRTRDLFVDHCIHTYISRPQNQSPPLIPGPMR